VFKDLAPPETNTYNSQFSILPKVEGKAGTTIIYIRIAPFPSPSGFAMAST
jgi:hypothetical protein